MLKNYSLKWAALLGALLWCHVIAVAAQSQTSPTPSFSAANKDRVIGLAFYGRSVGNLDKSVAFYKAIGFVPAEGVDSSWRKDAVMNRIHGTQDVESRMAKFTMNSGASGKPFTLYLREYRGLERRDVMGGKTPWEPGAAHFGFTVDDAGALWSELRTAGLLRPRSWDGKLTARPGETRGTIAYMTDPDGMDLEIIESRTGELSGFNHVGVVTADIEKAKGFYGALLGIEFPAANIPWGSGDFLDSAVGGHGNILRLHNGSIAEAADPNARMRYELVEYLNRRKPVEPFELTDIGVSYAGIEVSDIDALVARLKGAGAGIVSDGVVEMTGGYRVAMIRDFDTGAFVELFERPPPAP